MTTLVQLRRTYQSLLPRVARIGAQLLKRTLVEALAHSMEPRDVAGAIIESLGPDTARGMIAVLTFPRFAEGARRHTGRRIDGAFLRGVWDELRRQAGEP